MTETNSSGIDRSSLRRKDVITVERDDETLDVYNWISVERKQRAMLRGNMSNEEFHDDPKIMDGEGFHEPDAVTHWVAEDLARDFNVNVADCGVEVINVESPEVTVL